MMVWFGCCAVCLWLADCWLELLFGLGDLVLVIVLGFGINSVGDYALVVVYVLVLGGFFVVWFRLWRW